MYPTLYLFCISCSCYRSLSFNKYLAVLALTVNILSSTYAFIPAWGSRSNNTLSRVQSSASVGHIIADVSGLRLVSICHRLKFPSKITTFHFNGQQLDSVLVTSISSLLDDVNVPSLLWGNYLLTVYGVPTVVDVSMLS